VSSDQPAETSEPEIIAASEATTDTEIIDVSALRSEAVEELPVEHPTEVLDVSALRSEPVEELLVEHPTEVLAPITTENNVLPLPPEPPPTPWGRTPVEAPATVVEPTPAPAPVAVAAPRKHTLAWILGALAALALLYTGAQFLLADRVPRNTDVLGIQLGGMHRDAALTALNDGLASRITEPITLQAGDSTTVLNPEQAGLSVDASATLDKLTGFSMNPIRLWEQIVGHGTQNPVVAVEQTALNAAGNLVSNRLRVAPVNGTVAIEDGSVVATPAQIGQEVSPSVISADLPQRWLVENSPLVLAADTLNPEIDQAETDAVAAKARQLISGPITVNVGGQTVYLSGQDVAEALSFTQQGGTLEPELNGELLAEKIVAGTHDLVTTPTDAHFVFVDGQPQIVAGEDGTTVEPEAAASAIMTAALDTPNRTATVQLTSKSPEHSVADLEALGVNEIVAEFSTPITNDAVRTGNLIRGAELVTGTLVMPGEIFSLTDTLSPIDASNGFANAGVIVQGVHTEGMGGGLSQMATTTFNAGYFAGFEDIEHRPHSVFITRYPAGREATLAVGSLDMRFRNNTPYGAVLQSWVSGGELHVRIWSTPYFRVETSASGRSNVRAATMQYRSGPGCVSQPNGQAGFTITNTRRVYRIDTGDLADTSSFTWTYQPDNGISCAPAEPVYVPPVEPAEPEVPWYPDEPDEGGW